MGLGFPIFSAVLLVLLSFFLQPSEPSALLLVPPYAPGKHATPRHATPLRHSAHPFDAECSSRVASMTRWCHTSSDRRSHKSTWWPTFSRISSATVWPPAHDLNLAILTTSDASLADEFPALERYPSVGDINNYAVDPTREQPIKAGTYHDELTQCERASHCS